MLAEILGPYRKQNDLRIDDLVHLAAELVPRLAGPQGRYKVTEIPDARTVRYYIQEAIVDPPHGAAGTAARYGYRHLLQIAAVKVLQSRYLPIRKIREEIGGLGDRELETLLESAADVTRREQPTVPTAQFRAAMRGLKQDAPAQEAAAPGGSAQDFLASLSQDLRIERIPPGPKADFPSAERPVAPAPGWDRYELYPGVELHVRRGASLPSNPSFLSALASRLRAILGRRVRSTP